jgi:hypothetical protein
MFVVIVVCNSAQAEGNYPATARSKLSYCRQNRRSGRIRCFALSRRTSCHAFNYHYDEIPDRAGDTIPDRLDGMTLSAAVVLLGHDPFLSLASAVRNLCLQTTNKPKLDDPGRALCTSKVRFENVSVSSYAARITFADVESRRGPIRGRSIRAESLFNSFDPSPMTALS